MTIPDQAEEDNMGRLRWKCRRGMLELDDMLIRFVEQGYQMLTPDQQELFVDLLEEEDQQLLDWLMANAVPADQPTESLVGRIRDLLHGTSAVAR